MMSLETVYDDIKDMHRYSQTVEFFTIGVSVRLSDRSLHREEQTNFVKNCPQ